MRSGPTDAEQKLWRCLRNRQLQGWKFRRQHPLDRYIVDFVCADAGLVVELDGGQHDEQRIYDEARTRRLQFLGYRVPRFWDNDALMNIEGVLEAVLEALASPAPHPGLLPEGEREHSAEIDL